MAGSHNKPGKREFWEGHISRWNQSRLSQAGYCRLNKVSIKSFQYWRRKAKRTNAHALVELPLAKTLSIPLPASHSQLCLVINQRYRIEIGKGFDPEDLERLLRVVVRI